MNKKPLYKVKISAVHGRGVFAATDIPKGRRIIEYTGRRITDDEATRRFEKSKKGSHTMLFSVKENLVIDGNDEGNEARYINHSCSPNCEALNVRNRIYIHSTKKIKEGEELFYNYRLFSDEAPTKKSMKEHACYCGSPRCKGTMLDIPRKRKSSAKKKTAASAKKKQK